MVKILVLEDEQERINLFEETLGAGNFYLARTAEKAISLLQEEEFDVVCLDHDLGEGAGTGADVALFMREQGIRTVVLIHSWNGAGADRIKNLSGGLKIPFGQHFLGSLKTIVESLPWKK